VPINRDRNRPTVTNHVSVGDEIPPDCELIEVHVSELRQLFNPIDPSPPREKDLDSRAEEFIVAWARAAKRDAHLALQIDIDTPGRPDEAATVRDAVHEFFRQRSLSASRRLSQLFRIGRTSLLIGIAFLAVAVTAAGLIDRSFGHTTAGALLRESMVIGGWVALWRPLEIFLYDWWPILAERKLNDRLSAMPVRTTFRAGAKDSNEPQEAR
jgi:non-ribosomal peptide synthetase component F